MKPLLDLEKTLFGIQGIASLAADDATSRRLFSMTAIDVVSESVKVYKITRQLLS
jgi:hypothetical protein